MALIACSECNKEISDKAFSCPHCGAPCRSGGQAQSSGVAASQSPKKRNIWKWIIGVPVAGFLALLAFGAYVSSTPDGRERSNERAAIDLCWSEQSRKSNTSGSARFIAGACEKMERDFRERWGVNP